MCQWRVFCWRGSPPPPPGVAAAQHGWRTRPCVMRDRRGMPVCCCVSTLVGGRSAGLAVTLSQLAAGLCACIVLCRRLQHVGTVQQAPGSQGSLHMQPLCCTVIRRGRCEGALVRWWWCIDGGLDAGALVADWQGLQRGGPREIFRQQMHDCATDAWLVACWPQLALARAPLRARASVADSLRRGGGLTGESPCSFAAAFVEQKDMFAGSLSVVPFPTRPPQIVALVPCANTKQRVCGQAGPLHSATARPRPAKQDASRRWPRACTQQPHCCCRMQCAAAPAKTTSLDKCQQKTAHASLDKSNCCCSAGSLPAVVESRCH